MSQVKRLDTTQDSLRDIHRLQEENGVLQEQVEVGFSFNDSWIYFR